MKRQAFQTETDHSIRLFKKSEGICIEKENHSKGYVDIRKMTWHCI